MSLQESNVQLRFQKLNWPDKSCRRNHPPHSFPMNIFTIVSFLFFTSLVGFLTWIWVRKKSGNEAKTDQATPVNLTNHCFWNLGGVGSGTIHNHLLQIESGKTLAVDSDLIPTDKFASVDGTPYDFRKFRKVGERINENKLEPNGYDPCCVLNSNGNKQKLAATVRKTPNLEES